METHPIVARLALRTGSAARDLSRITAARFAPAGEWRSWFLTFVWWLLPPALSLTLRGDPEAGAEHNRFRMGVSTASFGARSHNEASAAIKAWVASILQERGIHVETQVAIYGKVSDLQAAIADESVDAATMTAEEFIRGSGGIQSIYLTSKLGNFSEKYVLLVHRAGGITRLSDLRNKRVVWHSNPRMSLALPWLQTLVAQEQNQSSADFFADLSAIENPSRAVLRLFFRQTEACVVTSQVFDLACELNPQVRQQVAVLAESPPVVPNLMFLRPTYSGVIRERIEAAIQDLHATPAGLQVLTIFQGDRMVRQTVDCLDTARLLLRELDRVNLVVSSLKLETLPVVKIGSPP